MMGDTDATQSDNRTAKLVDSLELVTARLLEMIASNNRIASSQTPEMRRLFDDWVRLMADEILRITSEEEMIDVKKISSQIGLAPTTVTGMLLALERQGAIEITHIRTAKGSGKNQDLCDCLL
jgi:predicted transcriptional regulator